ncbi:MAG TPA: serine/threonine-protein kinase [Labilithrix sp.]|nr:serine/threonine-protein kinase [Labilithrix sp.]
MTKLLAQDGEGERLDRFELIAEIASGGMATVFLARLSGAAGFQRLVAIKRLHPHLAREPEFVEMFLDEARLAARIHHPNVVPIQEVGESDHGYYLVMDYIEGDTLARVLAKAAKAHSKVPYAVTIRILLDVLAGLHAAHQMKDDHGVPLEIVHRDVSPQNILVGVDGVARVVDFGVARAASRLSTTRSGQLKGKLAYMAPEQARGGTVDRRADLFSCGIVLWEALATKRLFKGDGEAETLNRVLYDPILPPTTANPDVPKALEEVCMKALSRDIDQRFATAQEFGDELEKVARGLSCVGSVRDVSECLEAVMGVDLSQQRDAVRAWLARSEPSHGSGSGSRPRPVLDSIVTRVEGGTTSEPSSRSRSGQASRLSGGPASAPPEKVSSVSSAVIQVAEGQANAGPGAANAPASAASRTSRVALAIVAAVVLLGAVAWGARRYPRASAGPPAAVTAAPPATADPVAEVPAAKSVETAAAASSAAVAAEAPPPPSAPARPVVRGVGRGAPRPGGSARTPAITPAPPPSAPTPGTPDDLSHNPYR